MVCVWRALSLLVLFLVSFVLLLLCCLVWFVALVAMFGCSLLVVALVRLIGVCGGFDLVLACCLCGV